MSQPIKRPRFYENQILGASDLSATVEYSRGKWERHDRFLHAWGIVDGLELELAKSPSGIKELVVSAGSAIDGNGREIVVSESTTVETSKFRQFIGQIEETVSYPVFIQSVYEQASAPTQLTGLCGNGESNRINENFEITFGREGDAINLDEQTPVPLSDQPTSSTGTVAWRILLGYVTWDSANNAFKEVSDVDNGVGRRYAGVRADSVLARGGKLTLQTREIPQVGKPAVVVDEADGGKLCFGLYKSDTELNRLLTVDSKGNLSVPGKLEGALQSGAVLAESGVVSDGMLVPLPKGITQEQVDNKAVALHIHVAPRHQGTAPLPPTANRRWLSFPLECRVEARRVFCRVLWMELQATTFHTPTELPGICDYTVVAYVPTTQEA